MKSKKYSSDEIFKLGPKFLCRSCFSSVHFWRNALQLKNRSTGVWEDINPQRNYVVVTNDFIASGKDGYTTLGQVSQAGRIVNTYLLYTQSFVDHLGQRNPYSRPARADYSHQSVLNAKGEKLVD